MLNVLLCKANIGFLSIIFKIKLQNFLEDLSVRDALLVAITTDTDTERVISTKSTEVLHGSYSDSVADQVPGKFLWPQDHQ